MKKQPPLTPLPPIESDNLCKRLAEQFPQEFARWAFGVTGPIKVEKTELSREPIHADAVIFSHAGRETLHAEFQTTMKSDVPMPLRFLDYYVGFKRKNPAQRVRQVLIVLMPAREPIPDRYEDERTLHIFDVIYLPELDARELLKYEALLPLATLCKAESGEKLLAQVAARAKRIKSRARQRETLEASRVFAGLRYDKRLINRILKESNMLEESVIYQDILQKGLAQGRELELRMMLDLLELTLGKLSANTRKLVERLSHKQLAALVEARPKFKSEKELTVWLKQHIASS